METEHVYQLLVVFNIRQTGINKVGGIKNIWQWTQWMFFCFLVVIPTTTPPSTNTACMLIFLIVSVCPGWMRHCSDVGWHLETKVHAESKWRFEWEEEGICHHLNALVSTLKYFEQIPMRTVNELVFSDSALSWNLFSTLIMPGPKVERKP